MSDQFTEVTHQSWFSRIGGAIKGVLIGLIIFIVAFPLLFWNEGRAVRTFKSLNEGAGTIIEVSADTVDPANAGKLIHITGDAVSPNPVTDPDLNLEVEALKLIRNVEIFQWKETIKTTEKKNVGGSTTKTETPVYDKVWVDSPIDSSSFKDKGPHTNTGSLPLQDNKAVATPITVGAFTLNSTLVGKIGNTSSFKLDESFRLPDALGAKAAVVNGGIYIGENPSSPAIGDVRITFAQVPSGPVSIAAQQVSDTFEAFQAEAGNSYQLLQTGIHSAAAMFEKAQSDNKMMTWILRGAGFLLMVIGLGMIFKPLSVLADVLPILGNIVGAGTFVISLLIAFCCATITIAIAWIVYRPILGGILLVLAIGSIVLVTTKLKAAKAKKAAAVPAGA